MQCICWFYSQGICYDARSYDRKICTLVCNTIVLSVLIQLNDFVLQIPSLCVCVCVNYPLDPRRTRLEFSYRLN
jgi:hypothetical protein